MGQYETFIAIAIAALIVSIRNERLKQKAQEQKKQQKKDELNGMIAEANEIVNKNKINENKEENIQKTK